jgi:hypothetical protein
MVLVPVEIDAIVGPLPLLTSLSLTKRHRSGVAGCRRIKIAGTLCLGGKSVKRITTIPRDADRFRVGGA